MENSVKLYNKEIGKKREKNLAQAMSWMTDPNNKKVQLNASPTAFQYGPSSPSSTSNHFHFTYLFTHTKKNIN